MDKTFSDTIFTFLVCGTWATKSQAIETLIKGGMTADAAKNYVNQAVLFMDIAVTEQGGEEQT